MDQELKLRGLWWLPETPEIEIPGSLQYKPGDRPFLDLQGTLTSTKDFAIQTEFIDPPLIHGITIKGEKVTLFKCNQKTAPYFSGGMQSSSFIATFAFLDVHFKTVEEIKFHTLMIRFANIDEWANKKVFLLEGYDIDWRRPIIKYEPPDDIITKLEGLELKIAFWGPNFLLQKFHKEMHISQNVWIELRSLDEEIALERLLMFVRKIQNFLSLAMGSPTYPIEMNGVTKSNSQVMSNGKEYSKPVAIYYPVANRPKEIKKLEWHEMFFTLPDVEDKFSSYLDNWMKRSDILKPVMDLYFSILYNPNIYAELKFLTMAQALETYHRRVYGGKYQSDEEFQKGLYQELIKVIPTEIDPDFKRSLKEGKLKFANEFSLRRRLTEVIRNLQNIIELSFISNGKDRVFFIDRVVNTRNYLTHYTIELEEKAAKTGEELFVLASKLQLILEVSLLQEIGFDTEKIRFILPRSDRQRWLSTYSN